jgi:hypothetical protein
MGTCTPRFSLGHRKYRKPPIHGVGWYQAGKCASSPVLRKGSGMNTDEHTAGLLGCSLPGADFLERKTVWHTLARRALVAAARRAAGAVFRFRKHPDVETELRRLLALERQCCSSLGWDIVDDGSELVLTITGSGETAKMLDEFVTRTGLLETAPASVNHA